jgi:hypothetical protein
VGARGLRRENTGDGSELVRTLLCLDFVDSTISFTQLGFVFGICLSGIWCSHASADENAAPPVAAERSALRDTNYYPACRPVARLSAVLYDAASAERSFAVFEAGPDQRPRVARRGARIAGYEIASIERGEVVLANQTQRCSLRLRGTQTPTQSLTVSVVAVRSGLRARRAAVAAEPVPARDTTLARRD